MTAQIAIEAADFAALHTHAANRGEVLQVRFLHLCREVAATATSTTTTTPAVTAAEEEPASLCPPRVPLPVPVPPSLRGPGEPIPDPGNIDWDDPETYR